jgi:hypothetical protein
MCEILQNPKSRKLQVPECPKKSGPKRRVRDARAHKNLDAVKTSKLSCNYHSDRHLRFVRLHACVCFQVLLRASFLLARVLAAPVRLRLTTLKRNFAALHFLTVSSSQCSVDATSVYCLRGANTRASYLESVESLAPRLCCNTNVKT